MKKHFTVGITQKLIIYLLITSFLPLLIFGVGAINESKKILKNEMDNFTRSLLIEKKKNTELMMTNAESLMYNLLGVDDIKEILKEENHNVSIYNKLSAQSKIGYILSGYINLKGLVSIDIFSVNGDHYHVGDTLNVQDIRRNLVYNIEKDTLNSDKNILWSGIEDNVNSNSRYKKVISLSSIIKSVDENTMEEKPLGLIMINFDVNTFSETIVANGSRDTSYTLIDGKNRIIASTDSGGFGDTCDINSIRLQSTQENSFAISVNNKEYFTAYSKLVKGDWIIIGSVPIEEINNKISSISNSIVILLISSIFLLIILTFLISKKYMAPIKKITKVFMGVQKGTINTNVRLETKSEDEMGQLIIWFNTFLQSLEARREAEEALQRELKSDFRRTVENLHDLVFKVKLNEDNKPIFTLVEGKLSHKLNLNKWKINEAFNFEKFKSPMGVKFRENLKRAFLGQNSSFEEELRGTFLYVVFSPIIEDGTIVEVVGSAIDISELKAAEEKIKFMAYYDSLTMLPNRMLFKDRVNYAIGNSNRDKDIFAIMFLDLDHFKLINDTLGHAIGDLLLKDVAERLKNSIGGKNTISRMGGDEFTLLLSSINDEKDIVEIAEKVIQVFKEPFNIENNELFMTTSIGISIYPFDGENMETLIKNADMAMYGAKDRGRNNYKFFKNSMNLKIKERLEMERKLRKALEREEFLLYYQPQVDIKSGKIVGAEALIRWNDPTLGLISPGAFIPIAEDSGLIVPIGEWVLKTACKQIRNWKCQAYDNLVVSVNVSVKQFQQHRFIDNVKEIIKETDVDTLQLELEITENNVMQDTENNIITLNKLKSMGIKIAIDDFGTGFSSLSYIMKFSANVIKIDRSFINNITENDTNAAITLAIINMAHTLNLKVIAEGVETKEQFKILKEQKCDELQGYLFSKPVTAEEFEKMLREGVSLTI